MILLSIRDVVSAARAALEAQAVIFTDTQMLAAGITRQAATGRQRGAVPARTIRERPSWRRAGEPHDRRPRCRLWAERLAGAVVAIGNAPTALFHLLELIADGGAASSRDHRNSRRLRRIG